jgi:hypothetical protein
MLRCSTFPAPTGKAEDILMFLNCITTQNFRTLHYVAPVSSHLKSGVASNGMAIHTKLYENPSINLKVITWNGRTDIRTIGWNRFFVSKGTSSLSDYPSNSVCNRWTNGEVCAAPKQKTGEMRPLGRQLLIVTTATKSVLRTKCIKDVVKNIIGM